MSGDEAVAWAAVDSRIQFSATYPGTPTTDIQEILEEIAPDIKCCWSINEKVAYESALAVGISGMRALVSMKQVGLNVASDAFLNSCCSGTIGGLVLVVGDDPECHSSQHKQDSRHYRAMASTILLEPASSQEAYEMTREAFRISEVFGFPIMVRLTNRTAYGCTPVKRNGADAKRPATFWKKNPERFFAIPARARQLFNELHNLQPKMKEYIATCEYSKILQKSNHPRLGVVCTGIGATLAQELATCDWSILKTAGEPYPDEDIRKFISDQEEVLVLEEGDPILEERVCALADTATKIFGRLSGHLRPVGELDPQEIQQVFARKPFAPRKASLPLPVRLPEICKPCGYNKVFAALRSVPNLATPADIGCNVMGGLPPYSAFDGVWAMGSSIGVACGLAATGHDRIVATIGDSTFFHAGIPPLIEAIQKQYNLTVLLLDNGVAAMTGGQESPHRTVGQAIDLFKVISALGVKSCTQFDPHELGESGIKDLIARSLEVPGVKVLLYRSQCGLYSPGYFTKPPFSLAKTGKIA